MRRCAGIIRETVSPRGDGHVCSATVSDASRRSKGVKVPLVNAASVLSLVLRTRRSARLWLRAVLS